MTKKPNITAERLREVLDYNPETGMFVWKVRRSRCVRVGVPVSNRMDSSGYMQIMIDGRSYLAHRLAWLYMTGEWPQDEIDHVNTKKTDNRFCNLREATRTENGRNGVKQKNNTSGHKGVSWHKGSERWVARISINKTLIQLGSFEDIDDAARAYAEAAIKFFGRFARPHG